MDVGTPEDVGPPTDETEADPGRDATEIGQPRLQQTVRMAPVIRLGLVLALLVVVVEAAIMLALTQFDVSERTEAVLDPILLVVFVTPLALLTVVRPLMRRIREAEAASETRADDLMRQSHRQSLDHSIARALAMARSDQDVSELVSHVCGRVLQGCDAELLLANSSESHLRLLASTGGPDDLPQRCSVVGPWDCAAVRSGEALVFSSGLDLDACPRLRDQSTDSSAVCVPVPFLGRNLGVLHVSGPAGETPGEEAVLNARSVAAHTGHSIGTLRAFAAVTAAAETDGLTGLSNRRHMEDRVRAVRRQGRQVALLFADLDNFKDLNDVFGHETGDKALRTFAGILRRTCREGTLISRWGGEEFLLVLPGGTIAEAGALAERIRQATVEGMDEPKVTVSIGVSAGDGELEDLLAAADGALYEAKRSGRNRVQVAGC